eukprot:UN01928
MLKVTLQYFSMYNYNIDNYIKNGYKNNSLFVLTKFQVLFNKTLLNTITFNEIIF